MPTLTPSTLLATSWLNDIRTRLNAGGPGKPATIGIYTGSKPSRPDVAISAQVLLGTVTCQDDCGVVSTISNTPTLTFNTITADTSADASGVATWGRMRSGEDSPVAVLDFDISTTGGTGFGQMNTTNVVINGPIAAPSVVITA